MGIMVYSLLCISNRILGLNSVKASGKEGFLDAGSSTEAAIKDCFVATNIGFTEAYQSVGCGLIRHGT